MKAKVLMSKISMVDYRNEIRPVLDCAGLIPMAEQELAAFFNAVTELFGSELAELSAEDWLQELTAIDALPVSAREWRLITARASTRLASRLHEEPGEVVRRYMQSTKFAEDIRNFDVSDIAGVESTILIPSTSPPLK
jgi:hypothetical protein